MVGTATQFIERASVAGLPPFAARVEADASLGGSLVRAVRCLQRADDWGVAAVRSTGVHDSHVQPYR